MMKCFDLKDFYMMFPIKQQIAFLFSTLYFAIFFVSDEMFDLKDFYMMFQIKQQIAFLFSTLYFTLNVSHVFNNRLVKITKNKSTYETNKDVCKTMI